MADAVEPVRHGVQQKPPHEFIRGQRHHLELAVMSVILPGEADLAVADPNQPAVGDGDAVRVAAEIGEHLFGAGEAWHRPPTQCRAGYRAARRTPLVRPGPPAPPEKRSSPPANAIRKRSRNSARNRRDNTRTGRKNPGRQGTHRVWSGDGPPPGTMQCRCGWWCSV